MQAVIMAAGLGTRLRPHTLDTPKPMLPVAGRPILEWSLASLPPQVNEVVLVVNYLKEKIIGHFGDSWQGRRIRYVVQAELKGTGDALARCRPLLNAKFLVMNGDDLYGASDIAAACERDLAILAKRTEVPGRYGAFRTDANGNMIDIIEGAEIEAGGLVNAGLYVLDERFFRYPLVPIKDGAEFGLPQTLVTMAKDHPIAILKAGFWLPIGYPEDLEKAEQALRTRSNG
ncbi:MAG TPA: nucleotidyltransferase family protein [Candidatus Binatia bacterium]|jgi:bifunctional UDP-N-acetylglucosamine pyrophosphorylase/glucosamine-1-phosphate N-acetyltransferase|nr:nucleotidyltransferase family protein [Candidatus Binatia bacterium]